MISWNILSNLYNKYENVIFLISVSWESFLIYLKKKFLPNPKPCYSHFYNFYDSGYVSWFSYNYLEKLQYSNLETCFNRIKGVFSNWNDYSHRKIKIWKGIETEIAIVEF